MSLTACSGDDGYGCGGEYDDGGDGGDVGGAGDDAGGDGDGGDGDGDGGQAGLLTAGEWRDLDHWDFWMGITDPETHATYAENVAEWGFNPHDRVPVIVKDRDGAPIVDAEVRLLDQDSRVSHWAARTDNLGRADLFVDAITSTPDLPQLDVEVSWRGATYVVESPTTGETTNVVTVTEAAIDPANVLDLMFVVDTTGSMNDELSYLKVEMADVIQAVRDEYGQNLEIRVSMNFYRDVDDEYVVRAFPFTTDLEVALANLADQDTEGGGDFPEAMDQALHDGIFQHQWSPKARARLMFLVADAPYHNTSGQRATVGNAVREAAKLGVRIIPVEASGTDVDTQFLIRTLDILTGGTYVFLTDDSGIGDPHLEPKVGQYEVELLNQLMVRLITEALA